FRSWTMCWTSRGRTRRSARRPERMRRPASSRSPPCTASTERAAVPPRRPIAPSRRSIAACRMPAASANWRGGRGAAGAGGCPDQRFEIPATQDSAMARTRLDLLLVARGLTPTRARARALILAGDVLVNGVPITKAGAPIDESEAIVLRKPDHPWVSRGGLKLAHALDVFGLDPGDRTALDIGASTGGFTDVLLARGAAHVVALDVGSGQLDWRLRTDARVTAIEGVNARGLTPDQLPLDHRIFDLI